MYSKSLSSYQNDIQMWIGRFPMFLDYGREFAKEQKGLGLDIGCGPLGLYRPFFEHCETLDACDSEQGVVDSRPKEYGKCFLYFLGSEEPLPYEDGLLDFAICSCVIQHLNDWKQVQVALKEIRRVLKKGGKFMLTFKAGNNDTTLTHFNPVHKEDRSYRVFDPKLVRQEAQNNGFKVIREDKAVDSIYMPYAFLTMEAV